MAIELQKDKNGNVILNPAMGWAIAPVAGMYVLAAIQYATNPQELETGGRILQLALMPAQALELAETLTTTARQLLKSPQKNEPLM